MNQLRLSGFDEDGDLLYGPITQAKAPVMDFPNVPVTVTRIMVEYLADTRLIGVAETPVSLRPGQVLEQFSKVLS